MIQTLRSFRRLSGGERKIVAGAVCGAILTRIAFRLFGFSSRKELSQASQARPYAHLSDEMVLERARRVVHLQFAAERSLFFRPSCLEHSLVLQRLLAHEGVPSRLRLGGRKDGGEFSAHAWVEVNETRFDSYNDALEYVPFGSADPMMEK